MQHHSMTLCAGFIGGDNHLPGWQVDRIVVLFVRLSRTQAQLCNGTQWFAVADGNHCVVMWHFLQHFVEVANDAPLPFMTMRWHATSAR